MDNLYTTKLSELLGVLKIEDVIQDYIPLTKRGVNYLGLCPFHSEKSPSFTVSPSKEIYKCFGCGKSGNSITFLMELKNISYHDAVNILSEKYNIGVPRIATKVKNGLQDLDGDSIETKVFNSILLNFESNIKAIKELITFDKFLLEFCITQIESLNERIKNNSEIQLTNVRFFPEATLKQLKTIRENNSFRFKYDIINNQCLVLLISYFTSTLKQIFKESLEYLVTRKKNIVKEIETDIKLSFQELGNYDFNLANSIGEIVIKKKDLSFQDMQSTCREFKSYFLIDITKTCEVDNIILAQASRHAIVHSLGFADEKFITQISKTHLRTLKKDIVLNDEINFTETEIDLLISDLLTFINKLTELISEKCY